MDDERSRFEDLMNGVERGEVASGDTTPIEEPATLSPEAAAEIDRMFKAATCRLLVVLSIASVAFLVLNRC